MWEKIKSWYIQSATKAVDQKINALFNYHEEMELMYDIHTMDYSKILSAGSPLRKNACTSFDKQLTFCFLNRKRA